MTTMVPHLDLKVSGFWREGFSSFLSPCMNMTCNEIKSVYKQGWSLVAELELIIHKIFSSAPISGSVVPLMYVCLCVLQVKVCGAHGFAAIGRTTNSPATISPFPDVDIQSFFPYHDNTAAPDLTISISCACFTYSRYTIGGIWLHRYELHMTSLKTGNFFKYSNHYYTVHKRYSLAALHRKKYLLYPFIHLSIYHPGCIFKVSC